ncbi:MAG: KamA family protein [Bacteroidales bacterium]|nr:KamA family protein [Bacteroidales bacterium]
MIGEEKKISLEIIAKIKHENPYLTELVIKSIDFSEFKKSLKNYVLKSISEKEIALKYFRNELAGRKNFEKLSWKDFAAIRLLDYINFEGTEYKDLNLRDKIITTRPVEIIYHTLKTENISANSHFYTDFYYLLRQFTGKLERKIPSKEKINEWMESFPSGLDPQAIAIHKKNKNRIIRVLIEKIESGDIHSLKYTFPEAATSGDKNKLMEKWWDTKLFHLHFAIRNPNLLNELLGNSLSEETMNIMEEAVSVHIPIFVNPYYLSLLNVDNPEFAKKADYAIRDYIFITQHLVDEFGHIVAWEKEDIVEPGKPNAAGWVLPHHHNIHRRYPEVAILIPDTVGRACGGLCVSCQRMYNFQRGHLNFNLNNLAPRKTWWEKFPGLMEYFTNDSQLRDILITGGDALMSSDKSLSKILDGVLEAAKAKIDANKSRKKGEKYAEMLRVRLGTRLPVYLPQRITTELIAILADFKKQATLLGFKQFIIQTHFESPLEVTPEAAVGVRKLISAGWTVTNQLVFTSAASMRGHTAKLRKVLNDIGVLTYYTFSVKGYAENAFTFANNARAVQEQVEEKYIGDIPDEYHETIKGFPLDAENMVQNINNLRENENIPFLATDRNVLNLPGVGKSLTFRTIGITPDGRRILLFDHDHTRNHSPIIEKMGKIVIIESRSIASYLEKIESMGENPEEYESIWGYSTGETEPRESVFDYPEYDFGITDEYSNLEV